MKIVRKKIPLKLYKKIHETLPIVCVDLVVVRKNPKTRIREFLLVKRNNNPEKGRWWFPGGRLLKNEKLKSCALRKLKEETGLRGKAVCLLGFYEYLAKVGYFKSLSAHTIAFIFLISTEGRSSIIKVDSQNESGIWFRKVNKKWHPYIRTFLKKNKFR